MEPCRHNIHRDSVSGRRTRRIFTLLILILSNSGCLNTVLEVSQNQWTYCHHRCGLNLLKSAGIDWWSGEETCTCKDRMRYRIEKKGQQEDIGI